MFRWLAGLALAAGATAPVHAANVFADPLDTPARVSVRAARAPLLGLAAAGPDRLVAVGRRGHVLNSQDGGRSWTQAPVPVSVDLVAAHFATPALGFAVGHDGVILRSADGGASWQRTLDGRSLATLLKSHYGKLTAAADPATREAAKEALRTAEEGPSKPWLSVWFRDAREGWAVGAFGLILRTTDGGATWTPWMEHTDNPQRSSLHAVRSAGDDLFVVGELGLVLRWVADAGRFERIRVPYEGSWFGIAASARLVVVFGLRGNAWRSTDRGRTWTALKTGTSAAINAGTVLPDGRLVLASNQGQLLVSADLGDSFQALAVPGFATVYDVLAHSDAQGTVQLLVSGPPGTERVPLPAGKP